MESSNVDKETVIIIKKNIYFSYLLKNSEKKKLIQEILNSVKFWNSPWFYGICKDQKIEQKRKE